MRIINGLRPPGIIKSVRLNPGSVVVFTDKEVLHYRRVGDESMQDISVRRRTLPTKL